MIIGLPKEIKEGEYRVALTPAEVRILVDKGHRVLVEDNAGRRSGFENDEYRKVGADILTNKQVLFDEAEMIIKVKEPLPEEFNLFHENQILFTYLHLAANKSLTCALLEKKIVAIAYETVEDSSGKLPLLTPMSEIAGRSSVIIGSFYLSKQSGGAGIFLGGVPGVAPARVLILGGGVVGTNAAKMAAGLRAQVIVMDINVDRMRYLDDILPENVTTVYSNIYNIQKALSSTDLLIGAVLIPGAKAPQLVTRNMLSSMKEGSVIVDVAVDQGGCIQTARPTTHAHPTYKVEGILHYCVPNIPALYPRTSTVALASVTFPYVLRIAGLGYRKALKEDPGLAKGLNLAEGKITCKRVAEAHEMDWTPIEEIIK